MSHEFWRGIGKAAVGALLFAVPILMTMETWWLGFYMSRLRMALFLVLILPVLVGLSYYSGMKETLSWLDAAVDGVTAYGVGLAVSALVLAMFGVIGSGMSTSEILGKVALQGASSGFGAVLARSQLGGSEPDRQEKVEYSGYGAELFFMAAGALYLGYTVSSTEEMILIAFKMTPWHALALLLTSLLLLHVSVYVLSRDPEHRIPPDAPGWSLFLRFSVPGYVITLLVSAYVLWTFGRFESYTWHWMAIETVVLGFPGSIGAAVARLVF